MARLDVNRSGEMEVFARVFELGGFSAAARELRMTPSAISKLVGRLETRLGARLVNRSTKGLQFTPEGRLFYDRSIRLLADLDEVERSVAKSKVPSGKIRVSANLPVGRSLLLPIVPAFLDAYPKLSLEISLTDQVIDLIEQRTDVALRSGPLKSSRLIARKLGAARMVIVGSPGYFARHGVPKTPDELAQHNCLDFCYARAVKSWPLSEEGVQRTIPPSGNVQASDGDALRTLALDNVGLVRLASFIVRDDIAANRLVPVLEAFNPGDIDELHAVYLGQSGLLPLRIRVFLDFLADRIKLTDDWRPKHL
ncbi:MULTISPECIES: LysR family transcriptional regulator [Bradyrhizobium]|uniref:LysR family transcriptional regulator n=1 Tax=Bradyrhizobium TaxID=374 RepID=UPI000941F071|nr:MULTISPECIES: LysR family transcriptional regulator [Bradyrhizobium]